MILQLVKTSSMTKGRQAVLSYIKAHRLDFLDETIILGVISDTWKQFASL